MLKKKKWLKLSLLSLLAVILLAGCGGGNDSDKAEEGGGKDKEKDVLAQVKEKDKIVFGVKNDTRLFGLKNPSTGEVEGFDIDIAKALAAEILGDENKVEFKEVTSKTRMALLNNGDIDAIVATMTITEDRKKEVDFTDVYFDAGQSLLVKKGSDIKGIDSLKGKKVLAVKGSTSSINIREKAPEAQVLEFENYSEAFAALKSGQGDALTTDDSILYGMADEDPSYELVGGTFTEEPYGIAVKKGNAEFVEELNKALKSLKDSGKYDEIHDKWIKH
ncbi:MULTISPECIES: transporter substrate-binding domain-containing protein [Bacillaceae]|jgi:aspartate/glutamate/glutamine transport system substrate-binding protein|uniref:transporter substrate-binding domain-containing protein n=1 Tax=Bacillaceae TaxID=186817 RepID=UPI000C321F4D|nr:MULTISPECIES: transporter substrate-binding domain-containing protein [Bacillaceae]TDL92392.1 transporter substrate-binding domain-containing protein [Vibrio vulnificus]MBT2648819.1 transporter substrate-binding domain-containing protein [Bacillus sp. ISL-34]MCK1982920.1 transporter substrate-binding domain-containing protein [Peribacillus sp. Aquil_B1]MCK2008688.1 transporter substrate-binding domain-containing protein [Peribacillus sp. Aquil_B8]MCT4477885.1 transporter substrate-binding d